MLKTLSLALSLGTREKHEPVSKAGLKQTLAEHDQSFAAYVLDYQKLLGCAAAKASDIGGDSKCGHLPARPVYDRLPVEAQDQLRQRAEGASGGGFSSA